MLWYYRMKEDEEVVASLSSRFRLHPRLLSWPWSQATWLIPTLAVVSGSFTVAGQHRVLTGFAGLQGTHR